MPHSVDFQDVLRHFCPYLHGTFSGDILKIHSHACCVDFRGIILIYCREVNSFGHLFDIPFPCPKLKLYTLFHPSFCGDVGETKAAFYHVCIIGVQWIIMLHSPVFTHAYKLYMGDAESHWTLQTLEFLRV